MLLQSQCHRAAASARRPYLVIVALCFGILTAQGGSTNRDYTFIVLSDVHVGTKPKEPTAETNLLAAANARLGSIRQAVGSEYPRAAVAVGAKGVVAPPRALFVLGDLTEGHAERSVQQEQWNGFNKVFPAYGLRFGSRRTPVFAIAGNHDGPLDGPTRTGLIRRNRELLQAGELTEVSRNATHFALSWHGVHFVCLNLCPADSTDPETPFKYGKPGPGSWNDAQGALAFLQSYLARRVGASGEPVIVMHHYGFDSFSAGDWNWWSPQQRKALYQALAPYDVAAIFHGHNHRTEHYLWPDPERHGPELRAWFANGAPANPKRYDVISCGETGWVIRIVGDQMIAAHYRPTGWNGNAANVFTIELSSPSRGKRASGSPPLKGSDATRGSAF